MFFIYFLPEQKEYWDCVTLSSRYACVVLMTFMYTRRYIEYNYLTNR